MNSSSVLVVSAMAAFMVLLFLAPESEAAITCSVVLKDLKPCVSYLKTGSGKPPAACCAGASALASASTSSADKKTACGCIKTAAQKMNPKSQLASALARNCGITLSVPISPSVNCSTIG